jgi:hypothetical protein
MASHRYDGVVALDARAHERVPPTRDARRAYRRLGVAFRALAGSALLSFAAVRTAGRIPVCLSIAGSDSGGGAGLPAPQ